MSDENILPSEISLCVSEATTVAQNASFKPAECIARIAMRMEDGRIELWCGTNERPCEHHKTLLETNRESAIAVCEGVKKIENLRSLIDSHMAELKEGDEKRVPVKRSRGERPYQFEEASIRKPDERPEDLPLEQLAARISNCTDMQELMALKRIVGSRIRGILQGGPEPHFEPKKRGGKVYWYEVVTDPATRKGRWEYVDKKLPKELKDILDESVK